MKIAALGLFAATLATASLAAGDRSLYVGLVGGYARPEEMLEEWAWKSKGQSADLKENLKGGYLIGLKAGYLPAVCKRILALELEYMFQRNEFESIRSSGFEAGPMTVSAFNSKTRDSNLQLHSLFLNIIARYPDGKIHPYVGVGPGVTRAKVAFNEANLTSEGFGFAESGDDTTVCYQFLAGIDFDLSERLALGMSYRYFAARPTMTWANGTSSDYDPTSHNFVLELKCFF